MLWSAMAELPSAFYTPDGDDGFVSTQLTGGPWDPRLQHAGPPSALLTRALEAASGIDGGQTVRLSFDILRPVPVAPLTVATRVLRPGRRVEQLEATLSSADGTALMRATAWRMRSEAFEDAPAPDPPPPGPEEGRPGEFGFWTDEVAYHRALEWRFIEGGFTTPGPATVWTRLHKQLVEGEAPSPLVRLLVMADAASGISAMLDWSEWSFVNVDIGVHLVRPPEGEWMAMAATTRLGPAGAALCTSVVSDARGRLGVTTQSLLIARRG